MIQTDEILGSISIFRFFSTWMIDEFLTFLSVLLIQSKLEVQIYIIVAQSMILQNSGSPERDHLQSSLPGSFLSYVEVELIPF